MQIGVVENPESYTSLTNSSSFEDFQRHLHGSAKLSSVCPEPCAAQAQDAPEPAQEVPAPAQLTGLDAPESAQLLAPEDCHTAVQGDLCYAEVLYVMQKGVSEHPEWYDSSLTNSSSFEDIQRHLHGSARLSTVCPEPCAAQAHDVPVPAQEVPAPEQLPALGLKGRFSRLRARIGGLLR
jgi:hypothetical protein